MIASGTVDLIINTPTKGRKHDTDGFRIRRSAVEHSVGCITAIDTARAILTVRHAEPQRGSYPHRHHADLTIISPGPFGPGETP